LAGTTTGEEKTVGTYVHNEFAGVNWLNGVTYGGGCKTFWHPGPFWIYETWDCGTTTYDCGTPTTEDGK
jgi:hypothetical protein